MPHVAYNENVLLHDVEASIHVKICFQCDFKLLYLCKWISHFRIGKSDQMDIV